MRNNNNKKPTSSERRILTSEKNSNFHIVEAYKTVRANLLFALSTSKDKIVVLSGAEPSSGKSSTCANLASTMAQTGSRVILLDADMRKPVQHKIFRVSNNNGLSKVLSGLSQPLDAIHENVGPNLDLISSGPIPPNPSELLGSEQMETLLDYLVAQYDYIFFDTPPINVVSDALMLSDKVAGMILVVRQNQTTYDEVQKAIDTIDNLHGNILGVVLSDVDESSKPYSKYSKGKYGYYQYQYKAYEEE